MRLGFGPTGIVATTVSPFKSMTDTVPLSKLVTNAFAIDGSVAMPAVLFPKVSVAWTTGAAWAPTHRNIRAARAAFVLVISLLLSVRRRLRDDARRKRFDETRLRSGVEMEPHAEATLRLAFGANQVKIHVRCNNFVSSRFDLVDRTADHPIAIPLLTFS